MKAACGYALVAFTDVKFFSQAESKIREVVADIPGADVQNLGQLPRMLILGVVCPNVEFKEIKKSYSCVLQSKRTW